MHRNRALYVLIAVVVLTPIVLDTLSGCSAVYPTEENFEIARQEVAARKAIVETVRAGYEERDLDRFLKGFVLENRAEQEAFWREEIEPAPPGEPFLLNVGRPRVGKVRGSVTGSHTWKGRSFADQYRVKKQGEQWLISFIHSHPRKNPDAGTTH